MNTVESSRWQPRSSRVFHPNLPGFSVMGATIHESAAVFLHNLNGTAMVQPAMQKYYRYNSHVR